jgi:hypothetical protein
MHAFNKTEIFNFNRAYKDEKYRVNEIDLFNLNAITHAPKQFIPPFISNEKSKNIVVFNTREGKVESTTNGNYSNLSGNTAMNFLPDHYKNNDKNSLNPDYDDKTLKKINKKSNSSSSSSLLSEPINQIKSQISSSLLNTTMNTNDPNNDMNINADTISTTNVMIQNDPCEFVVCIDPNAYGTDDTAIVAGVYSDTINQRYVILGLGSKTTKDVHQQIDFVKYAILNQIYYPYYNIIKKKNMKIRIVVERNIGCSLADFYKEKLLKSSGNADEQLQLEKTLIFHEDRKNVTGAFKTFQLTIDYVTSTKIALKNDILRFSKNIKNLNPSQNENETIQLFEMLSRQLGRYVDPDYFKKERENGNKDIKLGAKTNNESDDLCIAFLMFIYFARKVPIY